MPSAVVLPLMRSLRRVRLARRWIGSPDAADRVGAARSPLRALGACAPQSWGWPSRRDADAWGGRLLGSSAADLLLAPRHWDDVDADDLVLLAPALLWQSRSARAGDHEAPVAAAIARARQRLAAGSAGSWSDGARHILRVLDALAARASPDDAASGAVPLPLDDADAALAAVATGFHPAYADARLACLTDTLTAAAWLGHLVAGRRAWLIPPLADVFEGLLAAEPAACDGAGRVVHHAAVAAGGVARLADTARRVRHDGTARLVAPSTGPTLDDLGCARLAAAAAATRRVGRCPAVHLPH